MQIHIWRNKKKQSFYFYISQRVLDFRYLLYILHTFLCIYVYHERNLFIIVKKNLCLLYISNNN